MPPPGKERPNIFVHSKAERPISRGAKAPGCPCSESGTARPSASSAQNQGSTCTDDGASLVSRPVRKCEPPRADCTSWHCPHVLSCDIGDGSGAPGDTLSPSKSSGASLCTGTVRPPFQWDCPNTVRTSLLGDAAWTSLLGATAWTTLLEATAWTALLEASDWTSAPRQARMARLAAASESSLICPPRP